MDPLIYVLIYCAVVAIVFTLVIWVLNAIPVPEPMNRVIKIVATVICVLVIVLLLLRLIGAAPAIGAPASAAAGIGKDPGAGLYARHGAPVALLRA